MAVKLGHILEALKEAAAGCCDLNPLTNPTPCQIFELPFCLWIVGDVKLACGAARFVVAVLAHESPIAKRADCAVHLMLAKRRASAFQAVCFDLHVLADL